MLLVGLTGGIASGKSTVGRMLAQAGVPVVDADLLAREAVLPGSAALTAIVARFGPGILLADGGLDRKRLGAIVFTDDAARRDLNAIVHPSVAALAMEKLGALRDAGHAVAVYEVPLLFESGLEGMMDKTLLVALPLDVQRARLMARDGISAAEADARIAAQLSLAEKRKRADVVIENDGTIEELARHLGEAWRELTGTNVAFAP